MTEDDGKYFSFIRQLFAAVVDQTWDHLTRDNTEKISDAALTGNYRQIKNLILNKKVDINYKDPRSYHQTPLMIAVAWSNVYKSSDTQHRKIISFLLNSKADTSCIDDMGRDLWDLAEGNENVLALLPPRPHRPEFIKPTTPHR